MSEWQMAQALRSTSTSPGPGAARLISSITRGLPNSRQTAAFISRRLLRGADNGGNLDSGQAGAHGKCAIARRLFGNARFRAPAPLTAARSRLTAWKQATRGN